MGVCVVLILVRWLMLLRPQAEGRKKGKKKKDEEGVGKAQGSVRLDSLSTVKARFLAISPCMSMPLQEK